MTGVQTCALPILIDIALSDHTGNNLNDIERKSLSKALSWLTKPMNQELDSNSKTAKCTKKFSNLHLQALKFLCQELRCEPIADPRKKMMNCSDYAREILIWVRVYLFNIVIC